MRTKTLRDVHSFTASQTGRLALSYLVVIMVMSLGFSAALYNVSSQQLGRQIPPHEILERNPLYGYRSNPQAMREFFEERIEEARHALIVRLILINVGVLGAGAVLSYILARRTLAPIETAMEAQSRFIGDASHELRTPLTAIQTSNEVALRRNNLTISEAKDALASNIEEVGRLQDLTNGLLSLAKQEKMDIHLQPTNIQELLADALNHVITPAHSKDIAIDDKTQPLVINTDKQRLEQVLVILLDNAIKYSHKHSTITVNAHKKGRYCHISVQDTGIGIRATDLPNIFKRFYRADQSRTKASSSGYGLGLSIADKIITQLDGEIIAESEPGKGSIFTIKLPLA